MEQLPHSDITCIDSLESSVNDLSKELLNISLDDKKEHSKKKTQKVLYIGVNIDSDKINRILLEYILPHFLENKTLKSEFHSTLEFKPKDISAHLPDETPCNIIIEGYGFSPDAIAFKVAKILTIDDVEIKHILKEDGIPHITIALANGINAADSYLAIRDGTYIKFEKPIIVNGNIKYYYPEYKAKK